LFVFNPFPGFRCIVAAPNINTVDPATGQRPFPLFGLTDYIASYIFSNFPALQAELRKTLTVDFCLPRITNGLVRWMMAQWAAAKRITRRI
jgi:hypothetical protein